MLEEYYKKHYQRHVNIIRKRCSNSEDASDIVQEAFTRACKGSKSFDPDKGDFGAWFSKILYRTYLDHVESAKREVENIASYAPLEDLIDYEKVYENRQVILAALKDVEDRYRPAIRLFYIEGYNVSQIHGITKLSETYIRQLCFRFKNVLKDEWSLEL